MFAYYACARMQRAYKYANTHDSLYKIVKTLRADMFNMPQRKRTRSRVPWRTSSARAHTKKRMKNPVVAIVVVIGDRRRDSQMMHAPARVRRCGR